MLRNRNYVLKSSKRASFVEFHFPGFDAIRELPQGIFFGMGHPPPKRGLHVVLKKNDGQRRVAGKIQRSREEIADRHIHAAVPHPLCYRFTHLSLSELFHSI